MKPPIIIDENGDIEFYATVQDAELDLEAVDVRNNEYVAYDSEGQVVKLAVSVVPGSKETVSIIADPSQSTGADELRSKLSDFFVQVSEDESLSQATLNELIQHGIRMFNLTVGGSEVEE